MERLADVTLLFTDLVGSTALLERLGTTRAAAVWRAHRAALRSAVEEAGGREVKHVGDGVMACFDCPRAALDSAVAIQRAVDGEGGALAGEPIHVRVGVHRGEALIDGDDYFGLPVVIARRLCDRARPGEILASQETWASADLGLDTTRRRLRLKGVRRAVPALSVPWRTAAPTPVLAPLRVAAA